MNTPIQAMVALVALQFALYATGWALCAALLKPQRAAALHWAGFMLLLGGGFWLASQRGEVRTWWAYGGSGALFLSSYVVLHRGLEHFTHRVPRDAGHLAALAVVAVGLWVVGSGAENAALRVLLTYGAGALLLLRLVLHTVPALAQEYGRRTAHLLTLPAYALILMLGSRALRQALDWHGDYEVHRLDQVNAALLLGFLVGAALFNFSFVALVSLRTVRRLEHLSQHDALTGLANRRVLGESVERAWQRFRRRGEPFAVVALDLDHFKRVNDTHGHQAGDAVLVETARRIQRVARAADVVARHGGEEFVVLMPEAGLPGAAALAERLLQRLRATPCEAAGAPLCVTASAGVAVARGDDEDPQAVLRRADEALYRAKAEGRDRVVTAD